MKFEKYERIPGDFEAEIFKIVCDADKDFVPPLSSRNSTTQTVLQNGVGDDLPYAYFEGIKNQPVILAIEENKVLGFMSIIEDRKMTVGESEFTCCYLSTLIVEKQSRGKHISLNLYRQLFELYKDKNIVTRTWSSNEGHLRLLNKLGFSLLHTVQNDRGNGIHTVYYGKMLTDKGEKL